MSNMILGEYTFELNPTEITVLMPDKIAHVVKTFTSFGYFSWGCSILGKEIELKWDLMPSSQFTQLRGLYTAEANMLFNPQDSSGLTFNTEMLSLTGEYRMMMEDAAEVWRRNVIMTLIITEQL